MATRAGLGKHGLAAIQHRGIRCQVFRPTRRVLQPVGLRRLQEEPGRVGCPGFRRLPVAGILLRARDWIGLIGLPPITGLKCSSHSSLNSPMFR